MSSNPSPDAATVRGRQQAGWDHSAPGWRSRQAQLTAGDATVTDRLLALAGIAAGMRVLDLACGAGDPALAVAARVGPTGHVLGLDLSQAMVDEAHALASERGVRNATFRRIASELELGVADAGFDAATCRFGVMFMPDPVAALAAVRRALKPGGRVSVSTWGRPERSPYITIISAVVGRHAALPPADPGAPGATRLPTPAAVEGVLRAAGFVDVAAEAVEVVALAAETAAACWEARLATAGPIGAVVAALPEDVRGAIRADAIRTLEDLCPGGPVALGGEAILAAGTNPG
jgi:SAM-dependent methyltransferase